MTETTRETSKDALLPPSSTDRLERRITLKASRARVWRALVDAREFGQWFGARLEGTFTPGGHLRGPITYPGYEHLTLEVWVEDVIPEARLSFRWHPHAIEPGADYAEEPTTLVEFTLHSTAAGTELTIVESGFDRIPIDRRAEAFRTNGEGWTEQIENIRRHVDAA